MHEKLVLRVIATVLTIVGVGYFLVAVNSPQWAGIFDGIIHDPDVRWTATWGLYIHYLAITIFFWVASFVAKRK
ncbi:hypothetical protein [Agathobaculum desmolans]|uniref:hypothetical protein n=1 Tax=Agathobaculum desmolans TaxID=39484 RepID=UPI0004E1F209|nr:hypothetical protein [Agathobaculum desmolans]